MPLHVRRSEAVTGGVNDDDESSPKPVPCAEQSHGDAAAHHHALAGFDANVAFGGLKALRAFEHDPRLRPRMSVNTATHSMRERRFHVRRGVGRGRQRLQWAHSCYPPASACAPIFYGDRHQPSAAVSRYDGALRIPCSLCIGL